jgi:hypothetical protein
MSLNQQTIETIETIETNAQDVSSSVIYTELLPNCDLCIGTEPPVAGFATDAGDVVMNEFSVLAVEQQPPVEQQIDLSMLPQNIEQCFGHPMWDWSKTCVACGKREMNGAIVCNTRLFNYFNCSCIRACPEHFEDVSRHFVKPEFNGPIVNPCSDYYVIGRCPQCRKNFSTVSDSQNAFCGKVCQGNWLDHRF